MGKPRNPDNNRITIQLDTDLYDALKERYPYAQMRALVHHILREHLKQQNITSCGGKET